MGATSTKRERERERIIYYTLILVNYATRWVQKILGVHAAHIVVVVLVMSEMFMIGKSSYSKKKKEK